MRASLKRIWNKLFGRGDSDSSMTESEKKLTRNEMARHQAERQRLQDEMSLRTTRNSIGMF